MEKATTRKVEEVVLERMLAALNADKRKMFDYFTRWKTALISTRTPQV